MLENMGRAIELFDHLGGMIKIEQESFAHTAVRAVGAGFQSVLFADPRNVAEVVCPASFDQVLNPISADEASNGNIGLAFVNANRNAR